MADRYTYLPLLGPFVMGVGSLPAAWTGPGRRQILAASAVILFGTLGFLTWRQSAHWNNSVTLWRRALAVDPYGPVALANLGEALAVEGDLAGAEQAFREAIRQAPDSIAPRKNLARIHLLRGEGREALVLLGQALTLAPRDGGLLLACGRLLATQGRREEAVQCLRRFLALEPARTAEGAARRLEAQKLLGLVLVELGWNREACQVLAKAREAAPADPEVLLSLGVALYRGGNDRECLEALEACERIRPGWPLVRQHLDLARRRLAP